jgi:hypothetical protein
MFEPTAHPTLADLTDRLRGLAGDAAYKAGRDYHKKGAVKSGVVAGTTAFAVVSGSTDYRVSVAFGGGDPKVSCTCPAHRRSKFCKHVVALCVALVERPSEFGVTEAAPEAPKPQRAKKDGARTVAAPPTEARSAGLETVDRLLDALVADGLIGLGPDKLALLAGAGELVRARKLRRLGNRVLALQRAATPDRKHELGSEEFARLVVDLFLTRQATGAHLEEKIMLDAQYAEDLLGKSWREADLEPVGNLDLVELAPTTADDGEFRVETGYLVDLPTGTIYVERQISPTRFHGEPRSHQRCRLIVDEAGLYPGDPPRRIRLGRSRRVPLTAGDARRLVDTAVDEVAELRQRLVHHLDLPFSNGALPVLFRPAALVAQADLLGALDRAGHYVAVDWPAAWTAELPSLLPDNGQCALFGLLDLADRGLHLQCLAAVGALRWGRGPFYPDIAERR